jgi:hypothetical protein
MEKLAARIREIARDAIPRDNRGHFLLIVSFIMASTFYACRLLNENVFFGMGMGGGFFVLLLLPFACLFLLFVLHHAVVTLIYKLKQHGNFSPFLLLAIGIPLAMIFPTPPTTSEVNFWMNKAKYEQLVELARRNELPSSPDCGHVFAPPTGFEQFAKDCILVDTDPTFIVEFTPDGFYRPVVYFEDPTKLRSSFTACNGDGVIFRRMAHNWYICNRDPN